jgi:DNA topoisomerase II
MASKHVPIEEIYRKLDANEKFNLYKERYIGELNLTVIDTYVYDVSSKRMKMVPLKISPAFGKVFDEILVNAIDHAQRDSSLDYIGVYIDPKTQYISITNTGAGIPIEIHKEHKMYIPEFVFTQFDTGSNFDEKIRRTGGMYGEGAKYTVWTSEHFRIETVDENKGLKYIQDVYNHGTQISKPVITKTDERSHTTISYKPDLSIFKMRSFNKHAMLAIERRVYDASAWLAERKIKITLNDKDLSLKSFEDYVSLFVGPKVETPRTYGTIEGIGDYFIALNNTGSDSLQQISFVNGVSTIEGGSHVNAVANSIYRGILNKYKTTRTLSKHVDHIKDAFIKKNIFIFIRTQINAPQFNNATKDKLMASDFKVNILPKTIDYILKMGMSERIKLYIDRREMEGIIKETRTKKGRQIIDPKYDKAIKAGTSESYKCIITFTEGDSAKTLVKSGFSVVGHEYYGAFPLRGKVLNVRNKTLKNTKNNKEVINMISIIGLEFDKTYEKDSDFKKLNYGKIMIFSDQDPDGFHIRGLIINVFAVFWPMLLRRNGFILSFRTPVIKITNIKTKEIIPFYSIQEYKIWEKTKPKSLKFKSKYYKGLGTSTPAEAKGYFRDIEHAVIQYNWIDDKDSDALDLAFNKNLADKRKVWLSHYDPNEILEVDQQEVRYLDFVNKELRQFSDYSNIRAIPNIMDGLKPSQRKVLFTLFTDSKPFSEQKVSELAGAVMKHAAYHHGEAALYGVIVNMAQLFISSNNIPLLVAQGQFGTRNMGGKDASAPRYIFTRLYKLTKILFKDVDQKLLMNSYDDGNAVEPRYYLPILPLLLVNGTLGVGTGWSTSIPMFNPRDIIESIKTLLRGQTPNMLCPWYRWFRGSIHPINGGSKFVVKGLYNVINEKTIEIVELPVGAWTEKYTEFLNSLREVPEEKKTKGMKLKKPSIKRVPLVKDFDKYQTDDSVRYVIHLNLKVSDLYDSISQKDLDIGEIESADQVDDLEGEYIDDDDESISPDVIEEQSISSTSGQFQIDAIEKIFKLAKQLSISNMNVYDCNGNIIHFTTPNEILNYWFVHRLEYYKLRRLLMIKELTQEVKRISNRMRFISEFMNNQIVIFKRTKADVIQQLVTRKYEKMMKSSVDEDKVASHDYLINMSILSLTEEKLDELKREHDKKVSELEKLKHQNETDIWLEDITEFENAYDTYETELADLIDDTDKPKKTKVRRKRKK